MTLDEMRYKLKMVVTNGHIEKLSANAKCDVYIISLAYCGLSEADKGILETELEKDFKELKP